jgi:hypothetical protein
VLEVVRVHFAAYWIARFRCEIIAAKCHNRCEPLPSSGWEARRPIYSRSNPIREPSGGKAFHLIPLTPTQS